VCNIVCVSPAHAVYFDNLALDDKNIQYTLRFPYEQYWYTSVRTFDFSPNQADTVRYTLM